MNVLTYAFKARDDALRFAEMVKRRGAEVDLFYREADDRWVVRYS